MKKKPLLLLFVSSLTFFSTYAESHPKINISDAQIVVNHQKEIGINKSEMIDLKFIVNDENKKMIQILKLQRNIMNTYNKKIKLMLKPNQVAILDKLKKQKIKKLLFARKKLNEYFHENIN
jgi:prenyltransferase beta subunit